jgi:FAD/FMN-containing dehydrogenase
MRRTTLGRGIVATIALAAALAACGGGGSTKPASAPTTVSTQAPSSGPDSEKFCGLIRDYSDRLASLSQASSSPAQVRQLAQDVGTAIESAIAVAPADIKSDATVVAGAAKDYLAALEAAGYDLAKLPPDAAQRFEAPDVSVSATSLRAYAASVCGSRS